MLFKDPCGMWINRIASPAIGGLVRICLGQVRRPTSKIRPHPYIYVLRDSSRYNNSTMYVKVRTMDGSQTAVITISKLTSVEDFRNLIQEQLKVVPDRQRLFYRGKQVGYAFIHYLNNSNRIFNWLKWSCAVKQPGQKWGSLFFHCSSY